MDRRHAAILAADVVGYTRLMSNDETGTLSALKACEDELIEPTVDKHNGRIIKQMGEGYLIEYASAVDVVDVQNKNALRTSSSTIHLKY